MYSFCIATTNHSNNNNQQKYGKKVKTFSQQCKLSRHALYAYAHTNSFLSPTLYSYYMHYSTHFLVDSREVSLSVPGHFFWKTGKGKKEKLIPSAKHNVIRWWYTTILIAVTANPTTITSTTTLKSSEWFGVGVCVTRLQLWWKWKLFLLSCSFNKTAHLSLKRLRWDTRKNCTYNFYPDIFFTFACHPPFFLPFLQWSCILLFHLFIFWKCECECKPDKICACRVHPLKKRMERRLALLLYLTFHDYFTFTCIIYVYAMYICNMLLLPHNNMHREYLHFVRKNIPKCNLHFYLCIWKSHTYTNSLYK